MTTETLSGGQVAWMLLLQVLLIAVNAFFAATELAVMQLSAGKLRRLAEEGDKYAPRMLKLAENSSGFLSTIQIGITLAGFLGSAFAAENFAGPLSNWLYGPVGFTALAYGTLRTLVLVLITVALAYFTLVFGELVPKQIAIHKPYQVARLTTGVVAVLSFALKPVVRLLSASTTGILRLFGIRGERRETVTEDDVRMMVDVGIESGNIDSEEKEMIEAVFELDKTIARDVMTHRVDVAAIEADADVNEIVHIIEESGHSRFPVYDDSLDDILGVLSSRTFLLNLRRENPLPLRELLRPARFVPETVPADTLLRDMQQCSDHMALVLDEYGGFSGVVSMEDLIEEIVGDIFDEFDQPEDDGIYQTAPGRWRIAGDTDIEEIEEHLGLKLPEEREYDTLGGLVFSCISAIPSDGESVRVQVAGLEIVTEPIADHHVEWAEVTLLAPPDEDAAAQEGDGGEEKAVPGR